MENNKITCFGMDGESIECACSELSWRPAAYGLLVEDGKILLCRVNNQDWDGYFLPGGGVELGEAIDQALKREFFEETGLEIEIDKLLTCRSSFFILPPHNKPVSSIMIYYLCRRVSGDLDNSNIEEIEKGFMKGPEWIDLDKLAEIKIYDSKAKAIIQSAIK